MYIFLKFKSLDFTPRDAGLGWRAQIYILSVSSCCTIQDVPAHFTTQKPQHN